MTVNTTNQFIENWWSNEIKRAYLELFDIEGKYGNRLKTPTFEYPWDILDWLKRFKKAMIQAGTPWSSSQTYMNHK